MDLARTTALERANLSMADDTATRARDEQFESLVREHTRFVFKIAYSLLRNQSDAEDAVQETFLKAFGAGDLSGIRDPRAWLARVTWRVALNKIAARRPEAEDDSADDLASISPTAEAMLLADEQRALLDRMIASLPEELRNPLVLSTVEGIRNTEIAEALGIPENSVRTRLFRARQMLKDKLRHYLEPR